MTRKNKIIIILSLMVLGGVILFFLDPVQYRFMPKCPFKLLTGLDCPGCGFQRAIHALLHGEFLKALKFNLFFAIGFPYLIAIITTHTVLPQKMRDKASNILEGRVACYIYVTLFTAWLIIRNILHI